MEEDKSVVETSTTEGRMEFDVELGGDIRLPKKVTIRELVNARINEIEALSEAIDNPQRTGMIFQKLPKRMRRRVMSHNAKRMPHKLRQAHAAMLDKCGATDVGKRPSRKYRRRPKNLREEYARRQRTNVWLETHIWHAKRFHMVNTWGYRLANYPNDKSFRACYRASSQHCLLQDVSYLCCIEIIGPLEDILSGIGLITKDSLKKPSELRGEREGFASFCHQDGRPIGEVSFLWNGTQDLVNRQLWIWSHPAYYSQVYQLLTGVLDSDGITVTSLKDELLRFRLTGPKSIDVLSGALKSGNGIVADSWASDYYSESGRAEMLLVQTDYYNKVCLTPDPGQLPPRSVLPALVMTRLPRLPQTLRAREIDLDLTLEKPVGKCLSPLWNSDIRKDMAKANENAKKKHLNKLVPSDGDNPIDRTPVSVLIVHRPGRQTNGYLGYGCGVDIICPTGWGMRIWLCLVHNGGRVGGLREFNNVEPDISLRPVFTPQSEASNEQQNQLDLANRNEYFRLPPAKRPNFQKFGILNPFDPPWEKLKEEWDSNLTRVMIEIDGVGKLGRASPIFLPKPEDLADTNRPPVEPPHPDSTKNQRKRLNEIHKRKLKSMAKQRKKLRLKNIDTTDTLSSKAIVENHKFEIEELWLKNSGSIKNFNIRETIGFISEGGYSLLKGKCSGYGFVTISGLNTLKQIPNCNNTVLIRNINSLQYRFAKLVTI